MKQIMKQLLIAVLTLITATSSAQEGAVKLVTIDGKYATHNGKLLKYYQDTAISFTLFELPVDMTMKFRIVGYKQPFSVVVNWGDGTANETFQGLTNYSPTHTYADISTPKTVKITVSGVENIDQFFLNRTTGDIAVKDVKNLHTLSAATYYHLTNSKLSAYTDEIQKLTFSANTKIIDLGMNGPNPFNLPNFPSTVEDLTFAQTAVNSAFSFSKPLPSKLIKLSISARTEENLNASLIYINSQTFNPGAKQLFIARHGQTVTPTGAGLTAYNDLLSEGWTITYN